MNGRVLYAPCPRSPTEMQKEPRNCKWEFWACGFAVTLALTFLGLYVKLRVECESRSWNDTSSAEGRMTELQEQAGAESNPLWPQLAAVNQSLADTRKDWATCQEELKFSKNTTDVLEDTIKTKEEDFSRLQVENAHLKKLLSKLNSTLEACEKERVNKELEIQHLKVQMSARHSSAVALSGGLIPLSLLLLMPGLLYSLL